VTFKLKVTIQNGVKLGLLFFPRFFQQQQNPYKKNKKNKIANSIEKNSNLIKFSVE
jgi:hypothetical protein